VKYYTLNGIEGIPVAEWSLDPMPGCPRVGISHGFQVYPERRGTGWASISMKERLKKAKELGFQMLLATVVEGNLPEEFVLRHHGWQQFGYLFNPVTQNTVYCWKKDLDPNKTYEELYGTQ
jgi:GNAT superfamily N-acetyltransferase